MKMVMAVVPRDEAGRVIEALVAAGHTTSFSDCRGGVLRQAQQMLFIAVEEQDLERVLTIIHDKCHSRVVLEPSEPRTPFSLGSVPVTAELGGAVVFIWNIDRFETY
ncbi:MAG: cyclic-di-AMP receptor [Chloroflexota bacterium]|nr:cyclic-di-AMP receptor [Chloroflexota bacterium]